MVCYSLERLTKEMQKSAVEDQVRVRLLNVGDICLAKSPGENELVLITLDVN